MLSSTATPTADPIDAPVLADPALPTPRVVPGYPESAARVAAARWWLIALYALLGITASSWLARLPTLREALGASTEQVGIMLVAGSIGSLGTVLVAGRAVGRWGGHAALMASTAAFAVAGVAMALVASTGSAALFVAAVLLNGVGFAASNVPVNMEAAAVERRMGRAVVPQFHAAFSVGMVLGSAVGAAAAALGVGVGVHLLTVTGLATAARLAGSRHVVLDGLPGARGAVQVRRLPLTPAAARQAQAARAAARASARAGRPVSPWREPRTLALGLILAAASVSEGSANNWLAIVMVDGFDATAALGAAVFGLFLAAMTVLRVGGTRVLDRLGRWVTLRVSVVVSAVGIVVVALAPSLPVGALGVLAWGVGAALVAPVTLASAADDPARAAARVSTVAAMSTMASMIAPPLVGLLAEVIGPRHALLPLTLALAGAFVLVGRAAGPYGGAVQLATPTVPAPDRTQVAA